MVANYPHTLTHACEKLLCQRWAAVQKTKNDRGGKIERGGARESGSGLMHEGAQIATGATKLL